MLASQGGHTETVKALIKAGAGVNLKGDNAPIFFRVCSIICYTEIFVVYLLIYHIA